MATIAYSKPALKTLRKMPASEAAAIHAKLEQYAEAPEALANNVIKLTDRPGFRLRVGDWRVIFDRSAAGLEVIEVLRRNEATTR